MNVISRVVMTLYMLIHISCMTLKPPLNENELKIFVAQRPETKGIAAIKVNIKGKVLFSSQLILADFKNLQTSENLSFKKGFDNEKLEAGTSSIIMFPLPEGNWKLESLILRQPAGSYERYSYWEGNIKFKITEELPSIKIEKNELFQLCQLDVVNVQSLNSSGRVDWKGSSATYQFMEPSKENYRQFESLLDLNRVNYPFRVGSSVVFISTKEW